MDRLDAMRLFVRVAELNSFSAVAQQQNLARSVVTRQIAALEAHLGAKLLARSTRRLALTSAGAAYLEKARVILDMVEAAETGLAAERQAPRGSIRLSLPLSFGLRHLAPLLIEFANLYPDVSLDMDYSDRRTNLFEEGFDLAIRITQRLQSGDVARRISRGRMIVVAAPGYLARHGEPRHPAELIDHDCLGYTAGPAVSAWQFTVEGQSQGFPIRSRFQANSGDMLLEAAVHGLGIAAQPTFLVASALAEGRVKRILEVYPLPELGIYAVLPGNRHVPHRVRVLMDFLADRLGPNPPWETV